MATWIVHLRVAENILKTFDFIVNEFLVGNIGPDSGVPSEDYSSFNPPKLLTHWLQSEKENIDKNGSKIGAYQFKEEYLSGNYKTKKEFSFLVGYYTHLLTDIRWIKLAKIKNSELKLEKKLKENKDFIWEVKKDWYGLDFIYLKNNKKNIFVDKFINIKEIEDYLDYFPKDAFIKKTKEISKFYLTEDSDYVFSNRYLREEEMANFVIKTSELVIEKLKELNIDYYKSVI